MSVRYEVRPLVAWPKAHTEARQPSYYFRSGWPDTLGLLCREVELLGARVVVLQVDVTEGDIRRDGMLRSRARVGHPGVVVSFESDVGPLQYATDRYDHWKANVRAIALTLEKLRAVDRYGVTHRSEQYVGWRALPAPGGQFATADQALVWMYELAGPDAAGLPPKRVYRLLARRMHPDAGGARADWDRLHTAWRLLGLADE